MSYVDGFVVPVAKKNLAAYKALSRKTGKIWIEHGALAYVENCADDVPAGKITSFPMSVKLKKGEVVVFSWIIYESRKHRDAVNKKIMKDPRMVKLGATKMPFDGKRLIYGGFKSIVEM